jgi:hypothetical protein
MIIAVIIIEVDTVYGIAIVSYPLYQSIVGAAFMLDNVRQGKVDTTV